MSHQLVVGYAGMTHLGLNYAVASAGKGFKTIGFDFNTSVIEKLTKNICPVVEPGLNEALCTRSHLLQFASDIKKLAECDLVYISTDVATDSEGNSNLYPIYELINNVISNLNHNAVLVVLCQVPTGFTRKINWPAEKLYYQVETLVFGKALERAEQPERLIVGCSESDQKLHSNIEKFLHAYNCPVVPMLYESAELTKMAINCYLSASVTITNTLAELCEKIGANWHEIIPALQMDKRIGQYAYLKPGLGISGGNLERDLNYIAGLAVENGTDNNIIKALQHNSQYRKNWVLRVLHKEIFSKINNPNIAVLGLTYKENTHSLKNSPAIELIKNLQNYLIKAYDPVVKELIDSPNVKITHTALEAVTDADVVVIMTPWQDFYDLDLSCFENKLRNKIIIDPFMVLSDQLVNNSNFEYYTLGCKSC